MINFRTFNAEVNPTDALLYIPLKDKAPIPGENPCRFKDIRVKANSDPNLEIGLLIPKGLTVINIDNKGDAEMVLRIIKSRKEKVMAVETPKGLHVYATSGIRNNTQNNLLAIGIQAGTLSEDIGKSYVVTPFKSPTNTNKRLSSMDIKYYNGIGPLPFWLTPIHNSDSRRPRPPVFTIPIADADRIDKFLEQLTLLKFTRLSSYQRAQTIELINKELTITPLSDDDLQDQLLADNNDDRLPESFFFNKDKFLHWKLGDYLIDYTHAVKNKVTKTLYFYDERKKAYSDDTSFLKGVITNMIPSLTDNRKNEVIKHMEAKLSLNPVSLDKNEFLINFKNGILDVETMKLYPHSPDFYGTIVLDVNYNPNARSQTADDFFRTVTVGDMEIEQLLYESIGYSFLKTIELAKAFILTGKGRTGKSTFLNLIKSIVGLENSTTIDFKELNSSFGTSGLTKLVSLAGDISNQRISDSDIFKKIVAGDLIKVNAKYEKKYDMVPFTTMFFSANEIPKSNDTTYAFYRRLIIIPFNADLTKVKNVDGKIFAKKLMSDESKEYVAYKAVKAVHNLLTSTLDFHEPEKVKAAKEAYRISNSSILQWLHMNDQVVKENDSPAELYEDYTSWCDYNNRKPFAYTNFIEDLENEFNIRYDNTTQRFEKPIDN